MHYKKGPCRAQREQHNQGNSNLYEKIIIQEKVLRKEEGKTNNLE